jgi:hypothetical protein
MFDAVQILKQSKEFEQLAWFIKDLPFKVFITGYIDNGVIYTEKIHIPLSALNNIDAINNLFLQIYLSFVKNNMKYEKPNIEIKEQYIVIDFKVKLK